MLLQEVQMIQNLKVENAQDVEEILQKLNIKDYTINNDLSVDVDNDVELDGRILTKIPIKFNKVEGDFSCHSCKLITLENSPVSVGRDYNCGYNLITSYQHAPREVGNRFWGYENPKVTSLEFLPSTAKVYDLEKIGVTSFHGIKGIIKHAESIIYSSKNNKPPTHIMGLLLIKGLKEVDIGDRRLNQMIMKFITAAQKTHRPDIPMFQEELIAAGYVDQAQM